MRSNSTGRVLGCYPRSWRFEPSLRSKCLDESISRRPPLDLDPCNPGVMESRVPYAIAASVIFSILVAIETQLDSGWVRFTGGDVLVVVLVYTLLRATSWFRRIAAATLALGIACLVEIGQAIDIVDRVGLEPNRLTNVVLGNTFTWSDIVAYIAGAVIALAVDLAIPRRR